MRIVGPASSVAEFFGNMQYVSGEGQYDGVYVYYQGDGAEHHIAGLSSNGEDMFLHTYGAIDPVAFDPVFLDSGTVYSITDMAAELVDMAPEPDEGEEDGDEDLGPAIQIEILSVEDGLLSVSISEHNPDNPYTPKKVVYQEDSTENFPAKRISEIIQGNRSKTAPVYADRVDGEENPVEVPNGSVTVWGAGTKEPLSRVLLIARKLKLGFALERHHSSRIHSFRLGSDIYGAVSPIPITLSGEGMLNDFGVFTEANSLVMEPKFEGIPDDSESAPMPDEPEEEWDEEWEGSDDETEDGAEHDEDGLTPEGENEPEEEDYEDDSEPDSEEDGEGEYEYEDNPHEMTIPDRLLYIEECAKVFADAGSSEEALEGDFEESEEEFSADPFGDEGAALESLLDD